MEENERLWRRFAHTGRVTDYLRYRGVIAPETIAHVRGEQTFGQRNETTSDHRGADSAGISQYRGE